MIEEVTQLNTERSQGHICEVFVCYGTMTKVPP